MRLNAARPLIALILLVPSMTAISAEPQPWKVINFWSITCAPCRIEIPELNHLSKELETVGIELVGVNFDDDDREKTMMLAKRMGIEFPTLKREQVDALDVAFPTVLPTTVILSPDGVEQARLVGAQTGLAIKHELRNLLGAEK